MVLDRGGDLRVCHPATVVRERLQQLLVCSEPLHKPLAVVEPVDADHELWRIDLEKREIRAEDGESLHLTPIEFRILEILCSHAGLVVTHRQLLQQAWGPGHVEQTHYLRGHMKQLRGKLEDDPARPRHLLMETGVGYRLVIED